MRRVSKKWLEKYFGLNLAEYKGRKGIFVQTDGGKGTWDFERPSQENWECVYQSNSKTYYFLPRKEVNKNEE